MAELFTIGHSNVSIERFLELLKAHRIEALADVRSNPYSAWLPHFSREPLTKALGNAGLRYVFLGRELGARREEKDSYRGGVAKYSRIAKLPNFEAGLGRVREDLKKFRLALMCAEKDPLECHRTILVCRHLREPGLQIFHSLEDGALERHEKAEARLMSEEKVPLEDFFEAPAALLEKAYELRGRKIAYAEKTESEPISLNPTA